ncbi:MAG: PilZ domain-containing protein [Actinobacteria bacterium]|nr:PilZ domain-containing protein [Actinomycetota bacterium]
MANATFADALVGYRFFLERRGEATIDEVNAFLKRRKRAAISIRTYGHYSKLLQRGFTSYIPINQFDVLHTIGRLSAATDRRKFLRQPASGAVSISKDGAHWIEGQLLDVSEVGIGVRFQCDLTPRRSEIVIVRLVSRSEFAATVVWVWGAGRTWRAGLRAFELLPRAALAAKLPMSQLRGLLVLSREGPGEVAWVSLQNIISRADELTRAARDLLAAVRKAAGLEDIPSDPIVRKIEFGSPGSFELKIDLGVERIIRLVLEKIQFWREQKGELRAKVRSVEIANSLQQVELLRNAFALGKEIQDAPLTSALASALRGLCSQMLPGAKIPKSLFDSGTPERAILEHRLLPAALDITAGDDPSYNISTGSEEGVVSEG